MENNMIELTADISKICAYRGGGLPINILKSASKVTFNKVSTITFPVHCTTHIDLPGGIDWNALSKYITEIKKKLNSNKLNEFQKKDFKTIIDFFNEIGFDEKYAKDVEIDLFTNIENLQKIYSGWIEKECIVLDFTEKKNVLENYLDEKIPFPTNYIKDDIDKLEISSLFDQLKISKKEIETKLKDIGISKLKNKIILFKTLWTERFLPFKMDINNPIFEGWHVFLTHPYLEKEAIIYLINEDVAGVASDSPSLENPIYYIDFLSDNFRGYLMNLETSAIGISPLHLCFLAKKKIIIENLWNSRKIDFNEGILYIFPYRLGIEDGTIVNVFIKSK